MSSPAPLVALAPQAGEEWRVVAERAEMETPIAIRRHAARRHALRLEAAQPPEEETDIADVPPALLLGDGAHVGGVGDMSERAVQQVEGFGRQRERMGGGERRYG